MSGAAKKEEAPQNSKAEESSKPELKFSVVDQLAEMGDVVVESHSEESNSGAAVIPFPNAGGSRGEIDVLEAQVKLIALFSSEAKMLESNLNKLIKSMYAKNPALKPELMRMKKLLKAHADIQTILEKAKTVK